jgi:hypothetical protein
MTIRLSTSCTKLIKFIAAALMKCWALSSAAVFACFFLYWVYGGFLAFLLLCFATTGKKCEYYISKWCDTLEGSHSTFVHGLTIFPFVNKYLRYPVPHRRPTSVSSGPTQPLPRIHSCAHYVRITVWKCIHSKFRWSYVAPLLHPSIWRTDIASSNHTFSSWKCGQYGTQVSRISYYIPCVVIIRDGIAWDRVSKSNAVHYLLFIFYSQQNFLNIQWVHKIVFLVRILIVYSRHPYYLHLELLEVINVFVTC